MTSTTLALGGLLTILEGLTYIFVGERLRRRLTAPESASALVCFAIFWFTTGANKIIAGASSFLASRDRLELHIFVSGLLVNFVFLAVGLACLMYYLLFLLRGRRRVAYPVGVVYTIFYFLLTYTLIAGEPNRLIAGDWRVRHESLNASIPAIQLALLFLLAVPQIVGSLMLIRVRRQAHDPTARYRLLLVPFAIIAWTFSIVFVAQFSESATMQLATRLLGILAALVCLMAYMPPEFIRRRLGINTLEDEQESLPKVVAAR